MTKMVRAIFDANFPPQIGTCAVRMVRSGLDVRVVSNRDVDVTDELPGEMTVRQSASTLRKDAFSAYLDDDAATEVAWRGGSFYTCNILARDADGMLHFLERRKNIIPRSGENIAAAEVEAVLQTHTAAGVDRRAQPGAIDNRHQKKRQTTVTP